ncbi:hypothetical protein BV22DRAFT_1199139 [Leucogyrophana mollusca]|uniref:Uncharacterized protein n=1 Tax=Leucogyrophana mollusca TaxID=85980 RepID=A0ACB8B4G6_9AGAM|nr:hypothetical protein BV22DRAFT_1199139 [Leucogyrophana mollusca]
MTERSAVFPPNFASRGPALDLAPAPAFASTFPLPENAEHAPLDGPTRTDQDPRKLPPQIPRHTPRKRRPPPHGTPGLETATNPHPVCVRPEAAAARGKDPRTRRKVRPVTRPIGDKTSFPNRTNISNPEPQPSSTRKHPRVPRQSSETPVTAGHHWDASDISVDVRAVGGGPIEQAGPTKEDYGDVLKYMPPKVPEIPCASMYDIPDYKHVGRMMVELARLHPVNDALVPVTEFIDAHVDFLAFEGLRTTTPLRTAFHLLNPPHMPPVAVLMLVVETHNNGYGYGTEVPSARLGATRPEG